MTEAFSERSTPHDRVQRAENGGRRRVGIALAFGAALVSGVAVFVNAYGVQHAPDGTTYTTAKNLVAAGLLVAVASVATAARRPSAPRLPSRPSQWVALGLIGVFGGGVAFALFFEGVARLSPVTTGDPLRATQAQFLHKTLVVWVAVLAFVFLRERIGWATVVAVGLLVAGQYVIVGDLDHLVVGRGELLVGLATLLWAGETVVARWLLGGLPPLTVAVARMTIGVVVLLGWLVASGHVDRLAWDASWSGWALATGGILTVYVLVWLNALARAPAVDVTAVLTSAVLVTYALDQVAAHPVSVDTTGLALIGAGVVVAAATALWPRRPAATARLTAGRP